VKLCAVGGGSTYTPELVDGLARRRDTLLVEELAFLDAGHRAVGLCNAAIGFQRRFAAALSVSHGEVRLGYVGLNHLTWKRSVHVGGEDVLPALLAGHAGELAADIGLPSALLRRLGAVPSYYLRYFYEHDAVVAEQRAAPSRAEEVAAMEERLLEIYADPALTEKPSLLERRGGAYYSGAAVDLLASQTADRGDVQVVNAAHLPWAVGP
jgi:6-phospho-beta-glucosidase